MPSFYSTTGAPVFVELSIALEEMQIRLPGDYTSNTYSALNKPNQSNVHAEQTVFTTLGTVITGASPPAAKPPATNDNPTDPAAAAAQAAADKQAADYVAYSEAGPKI